jgi:hypothetical protein
MAFGNDPVVNHWTGQSVNMTNIHLSPKTSVCMQESGRYNVLFHSGLIGLYSDYCLGIIGLLDCKYCISNIVLSNYIKLDNNVLFWDLPKITILLMDGNSTEFYNFRLMLDKYTDIYWRDLCGITCPVDLDAVSELHKTFSIGYENLLNSLSN